MKNSRNKMNTEKMNIEKMNIEKMNIEIRRKAIAQNIRNWAMAFFYKY